MLLSVLEMCLKGSFTSRIQHDQLVEFKSRIMEAHASLQKEVAKAKHEAREAIEAK